MDSAKPNVVGSLGTPQQKARHGWQPRALQELANAVTVEKNLVIIFWPKGMYEATYQTAAHLRSQPSTWEAQGRLLYVIVQQRYALHGSAAVCAHNGMAGSLARRRRGSSEGHAAGEAGGNMLQIGHMVSCCAARLGWHALRRQ
eukprot:6173692-Pleurochrysis_carterae.AAC.9